MRIVIDTNVIASAIFFGGKPYQLLRYILEEKLVAVASKEIVDEYEEIFLRLHTGSTPGRYGRFDIRQPGVPPTERTVGRGDRADEA